jgi:hypothetical protein
MVLRGKMVLRLLAILVLWNNTNLTREEEVAWFAAE